MRNDNNTSTPQTIYRVIKQSGEFAIIHKAALLDPRLSWKAKGIHCYMLAQKDTWIFHRDVMLKFCSDGKDSLQSGINELQRFGYASVESEREGGKIIKWITTVYEISQNPVEVSCGQPCVQVSSPETENPLLDKKPSKPMKSNQNENLTRNGFSRSGKPASNNNNTNHNINNNISKGGHSVDNSGQLPTSDTPPNNKILKNENENTGYPEIDKRKIMKEMKTLLKTMKR